MSPRTGQSRQVFAGMAWIVGLLAIAFAIFFLDSIRAAFRDMDSLVVVMPEAPNVTRGDGVSVAGYTVGEVEEIAFMPISRDSTARMALTVRIPHDVVRKLNRRTTAHFITPSPTTYPMIDIVPGLGGGEMLSDGDTLNAIARTRVASLRGRVALTAAVIDTLMDDAEALMQTPGAKDAGARMQRVYQGGAAVGDEARLLSANFGEGSLGRLMSDPERSAAITRIRARLQQIGGALRARAAEFDTTGAGGDAAQLGPAIRSLSARAERISGDLAKLQAMMNEGEGLGGRIARDSAIAVATRGVQIQLDSLIADVKKRPLRYLH